MKAPDKAPDELHGWRADETTVAAVQERISRFLESRGWPAYHAPKNLAMSIAIEAAELMELFQWVESNRSDAYAADPENRQRILEELADVIIYCFSLGHRLGVDIAAALDEKIVRNGRKYPRRADAGAAADG
ncbi:MAG TPA: nucleotide pyrophosphohydrolase [Bacillota bacterium]